MRLVQYREADGSSHIGALEDENTILDLAACYARSTEAKSATDKGIEELLPARMEAFLEAGDRALATARSAIAFATSQQGKAAELRRNISDVQLQAPLTRPGKIIGVGLNYKDHASEAGAPLPEEPSFFSKYANAIVGPTDDVILPQVSAEVDWEAELVVVIGKSGRHISEDDAMSFVAGYTVCNDVSARDWQLRKPMRQWMIGKTFDTFLPLGPALVTVDEVPDPYALAIECSVNGEKMQQGNTGSLHFKIPYLVNYLSRVARLDPGDIILTGTPAGVGMSRKPPRFLQDGDVLVTRIEGLGTLTNHMRLDKP